MHKLNLFLALLIFLLVGCANKSKVDDTPLISATTVTPTATPNLSEALPMPKVDDPFSSLPKNDLVNGFYYYADTPSQQLQFTTVTSNDSTLRIRLAVRGDKACYLATGLAGTDFEIESLVRERVGVWRGLHSNRYFTQPSLNLLVVYASETDKVASYANKSIQGDDLRDVTAQLRTRATKVDNITRLTLQNNVEVVYRGTCLNFEPIYFRGKLAKIERESDIREIETSLANMSTATPAVIPAQSRAQAWESVQAGH